MIEFLCSEIVMNIESVCVRTKQDATRPLYVRSVINASEV